MKGHLSFCMILWVGVVLAQAPNPAFRIPSEPIQIADKALKLSNADLTAVERALPDGKKAWLIYSDATGPVAYLPPARPPIAAYLVPDKVTPTLIRGRRVGLTQVAARYWFASGSGEYAQVVQDGVTFEKTDWPISFNRPFSLTAAFEDDEVVSIVKFMRTGTRKYGPVSLPLPSTPIRYIERRPDGQIRVGLGDLDWAQQVFVLKREGEI